MIIIDINEVIPLEETAVIIVQKTGIYYTMQCGGISCSHPEVEGYVLSAAKFAYGFDTCDYGCHYLDLPEFKEDRERLAKDFDIYSAEKTKNWDVSIEFDYDRIGELQEGLIPVVINGELGGMSRLTFENTKAFIHNGNCD